jgi:hypothetical protein
MLSCAVGVSWSAQDNATTLAAPDRRLDEPFSQIAPGHLRELSDGRLIVIDSRDRTIQMVDLERGTTRSLGAEGSGPREFLAPVRSYGIGRDSTLVFDQQNQRYLLLGPNGSALTTIRPTVARSIGGRNVTSFVPARASDDAGRLYIESPAIGLRGDRVERADSAAILRVDWRNGRVDTLTFVRTIPVMTSVLRGQTTVSIGGGNPLAPRDEWTVFPNGRVAIVRHDPYRVDYIEPNGERRVSPPLPFTRERLTDADKAAEEERRARMQRSLAQRTITLPNGAVLQPGNTGELPPLRDWPEWRPPFRSGLQSVLPGPNGELWIARLQPAPARGALYDVVGAEGRLARKVRLGSGELLVGLGARSVYTATADDDGLLYLRRHPCCTSPS